MCELLDNFKIHKIPHSVLVFCFYYLTYGDDRLWHSLSEELTALLPHPSLTTEKKKKKEKRRVKNIL